MNIKYLLVVGVIVILFILGVCGNFNLESDYVNYKDK